MLIKDFIKLLRNFFSFNRFDLSARRVIASNETLRDLGDSTFSNVEFLNMIRRDLIIMIVSNNFVIDPVKILSYYKYNYNFTINEFIILSFRVGLITKLYIDNPIVLLDDALSIHNVFPKMLEEDLKYMREFRIREDAEMFKQKMHYYNKHKVVMPKPEAETDPDKLANKLIDEWLKINKKR